MMMKMMMLTIVVVMTKILLEMMEKNANSKPVAQNMFNMDFPARNELHRTKNNAILHGMPSFGSSLKPPFATMWLGNS